MVSCLVFCILCIGIGKFFRYLLFKMREINIWNIL